MSLPMIYHTGYEWDSDEGERGMLSIPGRWPLLVSGPEDEARYAPEHLLLGAAEICLFNTFFAIAAKARLAIKAYISTAVGELEFVPREGYHFKSLLIRPVVTVAPEDTERAERVLEQAHRACLIARSLNCEVVMEPTFRTEAAYDLSLLSEW